MRKRENIPEESVGNSSKPEHPDDISAKQKPETPVGNGSKPFRKKGCTRDRWAETPPPPQATTKKAPTVCACLATIAVIALLIWNTVSVSQKQAGTEEARQDEQSTLDTADRGMSDTEAKADRLSIRVSPEHCPIKMSDCEEVRYQKGASIESWNTTSQRPCRDFATRLLLGLRDDGFSLGKADFLDLSGEAWGCTVKSPADDVYIIALTPERLGSLRDTNNRLKVNIVHVLKPPLQDKELSG